MSDDDDERAAWRAALHEVVITAGGGSVQPLTPGQRHPAVDDHFGPFGWAFITAWQGRHADDDQRRDTTARLESQLQLCGLPFFPARSTGLDGVVAWGVAGLVSRDAAIAIGRGFGQRAILFAGDGGLELIDLAAHAERKRPTSMRVGHGDGAVDVECLAVVIPVTSFAPGAPTLDESQALTLQRLTTQLGFPLQLRRVDPRRGGSWLVLRVRGVDADCGLTVVGPADDLQVRSLEEVLWRALQDVPLVPGAFDIDARSRLVPFAGLGLRSKDDVAVDVDDVRIDFGPLTTDFLHPAHHADGAVAWVCDELAEDVTDVVPDAIDVDFGAVLVVVACAADPVEDHGGDDDDDDVNWCSMLQLVGRMEPGSRSLGDVLRALVGCVRWRALARDVDEAP